MGGRCEADPTFAKTVEKMQSEYVYAAGASGSGVANVRSLNELIPDDGSFERMADKVEADRQLA